MGVNTMRMINWPKKAEFIIVLEALKATSSISLLSNLLFPMRIRFSISCTVPSTIITAPSTIIPKSMAPRLMRLAHTPKIFIRIKAKSRASGITEAVISPPRRLPSSSTSTKMTISEPSMRFLATVEVVR